MLYKLRCGQFEEFPSLIFDAFGDLIQIFHLIPCPPLESKNELDERFSEYLVGVMILAKN